MLSTRIKVAFGLAFDVEKANTKSGFKPARVALGSQKESYGGVRLEGFYSLLEMGYAKELVVIGGRENCHEGSDPPIDQAKAIRSMLLQERKIKPGLVRSFTSAPHALGHVSVIEALMKGEKLGQDDCIVVSSIYRLPLVHEDLFAAGLHLRLLPAEAFILVQDRQQEADLVERLGGGALAERMVQEAARIADKMRGAYRSRTAV